MKLSKPLTISCSLAAFSLVLAQPAWTLDIDAAEAPTNDLSLTVNAIESAQQSLQLNIYELSSQEIANALLDRVQHGVQVQILEEGQPVGGMSAESKDIVSQLVQAMQSAGGNDFLYEMTSKAGGKRRFRYDHAKYVVIDGNAVLVGSENYSPTGNPEPGSVGNRGWEVLIHDSDLAQTFAQTFTSDTDPSNGDIMNMASQGVAYAFNLTDSISRKKKKPLPVPPSPFPLSPLPDEGTPYQPQQTQTYSQSLSASSVTTFSSPDTSLTGLQGLLDNAATSIDIELMTFNQGWGKSGGQSPLLTSILNAAQRGVHIRVLLNDETVFDTSGKSSKPVNRLTIQTLQDAANQGLPIQALVANVKAMGVDYIHNKGVIVDNNRTMISSINWDENSVQHNRETAVVITSADVSSHYESLFEQDWEASGGSSGGNYSLQSKAMSKLLVPSTAVSSMRPTASALSCPNAIDVSVQIGDVSSNDEDGSFASLADQNFDMRMVRARSGSACIFESADRTNHGRVFEIRGSHGETLYILEGYTATGKIYSIRARSDEPLNGSESLDARVYDGSAGRALGQAEMQISVE